jgi:hypothetical protein
LNSLVFEQLLHVTQTGHHALFLTLKLLQIAAAFCAPGNAVGDIAFEVLLGAGGASFREPIAADLANLNLMQPQTKSA